MSTMPANLETPPLTRGRPQDVDVESVGHRNTPAYAGKTHFVSFPASRLEKHPRLREEDGTVNLSNGGYGETPPLTRGRRSLEGSAALSVRNTPLTRGRPGAPWTSRGAPETPPLTRGRLIVHREIAIAQRNTPAYAGKTACRPYAWRLSKKHPRLRGEDLHSCSATFKPSETPPLTRGRPLLLVAPWVKIGNTPAYAGKTATSRKGSGG